MQRTLEMTLIAATLCLGVGSLASAQAAECAQDSDCGEGMRCEAGLELAGCPEPPCQEVDLPPSHCVDARLGEACTEDADCGSELVCAHTVVATDCVEGEPDCKEEISDQGFCADNTTLIASSGLAPEGPAPASASAGAAGGSAEPGTPETGTPDKGMGSTSSSSSCSIGGDTGGLVGWAPLALALAVLGRRRKTAAVRG